MESDECFLWLVPTTTNLKRSLSRRLVWRKKNCRLTRRAYHLNNLRRATRCSETRFPKSLNTYPPFIWLRCSSFSFPLHDTNIFTGFCYESPSLVHRIFPLLFSLSHSFFPLVYYTFSFDAQKFTCRITSSLNVTRFMSVLE